MDPSPSIPRRRFVKLLAASAASLAMTSSPARAAAQSTARHRGATAAQPKSTALDKELRTEKKSVADMLKAVRSYKLPAGSAPAMVFRPMKARRGRTS